ncbi:MAG: hypothetical protein Q8O32_00750 [bacterium]|nr:hypothetical protein [bacterium]
MFEEIKKSQQGAAALVSAMIISFALFSLVLSILAVSLNMKESTSSFGESIRNFYAAEAGVGETLYQLKKEHNNFSFDNFMVGNVEVLGQFVDLPGLCLPIPECQFLPGSGWWGEYFNYSVTHPDMDVDPYPGPTPTPTEHDWYDDTYKIYEQIDANLNFPSSGWFPYDGTVWEYKEGFPHDYHFGMHWRAKVTAPSSGDYAYTLASDDDSWVLRSGIVVVNNSGTHAAFVKTGTIFLSVGDNIIEVYFAERHDVESGFNFRFNDTNLIITPWPEGCGDDLECNSNIEANASSTRAWRKARYTCNQDVANCAWSELIP